MSVSEHIPRPVELTRLVGVAIVGGLIIGLVGVAFRWTLIAAGTLWEAYLQWARNGSPVLWVLPVAAAAVAAGVARLMVRWAPEAAGSGVQRVEAEFLGDLRLDPHWRTIPAKFVGGVLALGSGLALGREGPTVQMGAVAGAIAAKRAGLSEDDQRQVASAIGGAGLGVAFSAPLGGAMFVFEEVAHAFRTTLIVVTIAGTAAAMSVTYLLLGYRPVFPVPEIEPAPLWHLLPYAVLGVLLGLLGIAYNRLVLAMLDLMNALRRWPPEVKAAIVGGFVGVIGLLAPGVVGSGELATDAVLVGGLSVSTMALLLIVRWFLGPLSYSAGTPGGLFAPLLLVGALVGVLAASGVNAVFPDAQLSTLAFGIVGMSTFFAAVVRAPFTGVILIVEMTATATLVLPMVLAAGVAVIVTVVLKAPPIYESLRARLPH